MIKHMTVLKSKKQYRDNILVFDCESYVPHMLENHTKEEHKDYIDTNGRRIDMKNYLTCSRIRDEKRTFENVTNADTNIQESFWKYVHSKALLQPKKDIYCYGHYVTADVLQSAAIPELLKLGYEIVSYNLSQPFFINLINVKTDTEIHIWDSWALFASKVSKIGESLHGRDLKKGDFHSHDEKPTIENMQERIEYCIRDVDIIFYALEDLQKWLFENEFGGISMTGAGVSLKAFRSKFLKEGQIELHNHQTAINIERECYHGGRTEMWRRGKLTNIPYIDINSMYPAEMQNQSFPTKLIHVSEFKKPLEMSPKIKERLNYYFESNLLVCMIVEVDTDEPVFAKKHEGRTVFPVGKFTTGLCTPEIKYAIEHDMITKIIGFCVYESDKIFEEFVTFFYNLRLSYKNLGLTALEFFVKIILNSLYGKFGQMETEQMEYDEFDTELCDVEFGTTIVHGQHMDIINKKAYINYRQGNADNAFVAIAAHVTSYCRMKLWGLISKVGRSEVLYMDTDSLHLTEKGYKIAIELGFIDPQELGKFKLEFICESVEFFGCKDYTMTYWDISNEKMVTKNKKKGINLEKTHEMEPNDYETARGYSVKDGLKHGDLSSYGNNYVAKTYSGIYTKGTLKENGIVVPLVLGESTEEYQALYTKRKEKYKKRKLTEKEIEKIATRKKEKALGRQAIEDKKKVREESKEERESERKRKSAERTKKHREEKRRLKNEKT
jgi:hypothetical protein